MSAPQKKRVGDPIRNADGDVFVPIYRKVLVGDIPVGTGGDSFEYAALRTMADIVKAENRESANSGEPIHDTLETQFEGHRVKISLGDFADQD